MGVKIVHAVLSRRADLHNFHSFCFQKEVERSGESAREERINVHPENGNLHSRANLGAVHGAEDGKTGAHQRSGDGGVHLLRNREGEVFVRTNMA